MKLLIVEPSHHGHHLSYVSHIIEAAILENIEVVLHLGQGATETEEFAEFIENKADAISVKSTLRPLPTGRLNVYRAINAAIEESCRAEHPEVLVSPTADFSAVATGLGRLTKLGGFGNSIKHSECLLTKVGFTYPRSQRALLDWVEHIGLRLSPWNTIGLVDSLAYHFIKENTPWLHERTKLFPDPVSVIRHGLTRDEARSELGLPLDRFTFVCPGLIRSGKGIRELVSAFAEASRQIDTTLLLIGRVRSDVSEFLSQPLASSLANSGKLIVMDRFLSSRELDIAITAGNVTCCTYPKQNHPSSIAIKSLTQNRPVLGSDSLWMGKMGRDFNMGWQGPIENKTVFAGVICEAFNNASGWTRSKRADRLVKFHSSENFIDTWRDSFRKIEQPQRPDLAMNYGDVRKVDNENSASLKPRIVT